MKSVRMRRPQITGNYRSNVETHMGIRGFFEFRAGVGSVRGACCLPPRINDAPLTAALRSEKSALRKERGRMQRQNPSPSAAGWCGLPLVGPASLGQRRDGRSAPGLIVRDEFRTGNSSNRVARQQSPSPLHRHEQLNTHSSEPRAKGDISTLPARGHFYFALTILIRLIDEVVILRYHYETGPPYRPSSRWFGSRKRGT